MFDDLEPWPEPSLPTVSARFEKVPGEAVAPLLPPRPALPIVTEDGGEIPVLDPPPASPVESVVERATYKHSVEAHDPGVDVWEVAAGRSEDAHIVAPVSLREVIDPPR